MPVIFITDGLVFFLLLIILSFIVYARRYEHLTVPWKSVARKPLAMASAVILLCYVIIGLLDCLHFHPRLENTEASEENAYSTEIISVLDVLTDHLRQMDEKTYSAPFATHAYAKETIELENGETLRDYPRLNYGGAHLGAALESKTQDILMKSLWALCMALIIWLALCLSVVFIFIKTGSQSFQQALTALFTDEEQIMWRVITLTLLVVISMLTVGIYLSQFYHILGTDKVGQDVFYQGLKGIRTGLVIGTLTTLVMLPFALLLGLMAGYFRGWIDDTIQYLYTTLNSIPGVLLIAAAILMLEVYMTNHAEDFTSTMHRSDLRLFFLCIILGITSWTGLCRLLRGEALKLREIDYVQAAQAFGVNHLAILLRHLLPNVMHIVIFTIVIDFSGLVLAEAVLAYINIGVDPSMFSWGNMINSARLEMARDPIVWWSLFSAFIFMLGLVLPANLFADAVRDAFDPRIRNLR